MNTTTTPRPKITDDAIIQEAAKLLLPNMGEGSRRIIPWEDLEVAAEAEK